jgi:hypothetical protein
MIKTFLALVALSTSCFASAASFLTPNISPVFSTADLNFGPAIVSGPGLEGGLSNPNLFNVSRNNLNGLTFQFEFGESNDYWLNLFSPPGGQSTFSFSGDYSFATQPGYAITSVYAAMGGTYVIRGSGSFNALASLNVSNALELDNLSAIPHSAGENLAWSEQSPRYNFAASRQSINGSASFEIAQNPILVLDSTGIPTPSFTVVRGLSNSPSNGPSLFVTVEQVVSAVPEPS